MNRRKFVQSAVASGAVPGAFWSQAAGIGHEGAGGAAQQWYELRTYVFANADQRRLTESYLGKAYLPALNRAGIKNIGVLSETQALVPGTGKLYLLIPYPSIASFAGIGEVLGRDAAYKKDGEAYLAAPAAGPGYDRIESSLLKAFAHMPLLEAPEKKDRIFELRTYESPTESAGQKKIEMFNSAGEIDVFKKIGARPVFFGETMIGQRRPNLTYMLCFDNMEKHDACWKAFGSDPDWKKISAMPEYADALLISKITKTFLTPTEYSQI